MKVKYKLLKGKTSYTKYITIFIQQNPTKQNNGSK